MREISFIGERTQQVDRFRQGVEEALAGIEATRQGLFNVFFIDGPDDKNIKVTPENADEIDLFIRETVADRYPDLAPTTTEGRQ